MVLLQTGTSVASVKLWLAKISFWGLGMIVVKLSHQTSNHLMCHDPLPPGHSKSEPFYNLFHSMA